MTFGGLSGRAAFDVHICRRELRHVNFLRSTADLNRLTCEMKEITTRTSTAVGFLNLHDARTLYHLASSIKKPESGTHADRDLETWNRISELRQSTNFREC